MMFMKSSLLLLLGLLPSSLACTDNSAYVFAPLKTCAWIIVNASKATERQAKWCSQTINGSVVMEECPVACDSCPTAPTPTAAPTKMVVTPAPAGTPTSACNDSSLRIKIERDGEIISRFSWEKLELKS